MAVITPIRGEDVECDSIVDCAAGSFNRALNFSQYETRLRPGIAGADNLAVMIRCGLAGDKYHPARLGNVDQRITPSRHRQSIGIECGLCHWSLLLFNVVSVRFKASCVQDSSVV